MKVHTIQPRTNFHNDRLSLDRQDYGDLHMLRIMKAFISRRFEELSIPKTGP